MLQRGKISQKTCNYLTTDIARTQQLYMLPKNHKNHENPHSRPIVSDSGAPLRKCHNLWTAIFAPQYHFQGHILRTPQTCLTLK